MATPNIFSEHHLKTMRYLYMRMMLQPADVTEKINLKFKTDFTVSQIQRVINSRGWSKRRKAIVAKAGEVEAVKDSQIIRELAQAHGRVLDQVVESTKVGLTKAAQFVASANDARSLLAASSAQKSLLSSFRIAAGIDNASNTARPNVYQFNFAQARVEDVTNVTPAPAAVDLGADEDLDLDTSDD